MAAVSDTKAQHDTEAVAAAAGATVPPFTAPVTIICPDPSLYDSQLEAKVGKIKDLFSGFNIPEIDVHRSSPLHYRCRSEFTVWHDGDDMYYVMFEKVPGQKKPQRVRVDEFTVGSTSINALMASLRQYVLGSTVLKERLFQANFQTTLSGEAMVSLLYHKKLDDAWTAAAQQLRQHLAKSCSEGQSVPHVIGRSKKQKVMLDCDYVTERMNVNGRDYSWRQVRQAAGRRLHCVSACKAQLLIACGNQYACS